MHVKLSLVSICTYLCDSYINLAYIINIKRKNLQGEFTNFKAEIKLFLFVLTIFPLKTINPVLLANISLALSYVMSWFFLRFPDKIFKLKYIDFS